MKDILKDVTRIIIGWALRIGLSLLTLFFLGAGVVLLFNQDQSFAEACQRLWELIGKIKIR